MSGNRPDVTTRGPMPVHQSSEDWQREDSKPRVNESPLLAPSVRFIKLLSSSYCGNRRYRTNEFLFVEELGKTTPIKKAKGDDPKAPAYAKPRSLPIQK